MQGQGLDSAASFQSAVQVAKRYCLCAMLGISADETVEGDARLGGMREEDRVKPDMTNREGQIVMPRGSDCPHDAPKTEKARAGAEAIIKQMEEVKTVKGVHGAYTRNGPFIEMLREHYPQHYSNVFDRYSALTEESE